MKPTLNLQNNSYVVCSNLGYTLAEAFRHWKARFRSIEEFASVVITHESLAPLMEYVAAHWNETAAITTQEAFSEKDFARRRVMFDCIGVATLFKSLEPTLLNAQKINKHLIRWDSGNQPYESIIDDAYELYQIDGKALFGDAIRENPDLETLHAVRCWCPSTQRECWIYVSFEAAMGKPRWYRESEYQPDAIRAIAWTIQIDVASPKRIFRQGDIIIVEMAEDSKIVEPYHLSKEDYLRYMYSET